MWVDMKTRREKEKIYGWDLIKILIMINQFKFFFELSKAKLPTFSKLTCWKNKNKKKKN